MPVSRRPYGVPGHSGERIRIFDFGWALGVWIAADSASFSIGDLPLAAMPCSADVSLGGLCSSGCGGLEEDMRAPCVPMESEAGRTNACVGLPCRIVYEWEWRVVCIHSHASVLSMTGKPR